MEKQEILNKYNEKQDKLLISHILDKMQLSEKKNKIEVTDFLDLRQISIAEEVVKSYKIDNYIFYGGTKETERKALVIYPEKFNKEIVKNNMSNFMQVIRILLPKELNEKYSHRDYLGGVIKLGIEREKIGDIIVSDEGADIVVKKEIVAFLLQNIKSLTRFNKSSVTVEDIKDAKSINQKKEEIQIMSSSLRLDNIVSEIINVSRSKAVDYIVNERVFVNFKCEIKKTKIIKLGDIISIRGKGRFVIKDFIAKTKSGRDVIAVDKYV